MADDDYRRLAAACACEAQGLSLAPRLRLSNCAVCAREFSQTVRPGPPAKYCSKQCKAISLAQLARKRHREKALSKHRQSQTCAHCLAEFVYHRVKKFCSLKCRQVANARANGIQEREARNAALRAASRHTFNCQRCGSQSHRALSGKYMRTGGGNKWCSRDCMLAAYQEARVLRKLQEQAARSVKAAERQAAADERARARDLARAEKRAEVKQPKVRRCTCVQCGVEFESLRRVRLCSPECSKARTKSLPSHKANKRKWRLARKAMERTATVESFDPFEVFERDGWTCQICGTPTPKRLRGTFKPNAPELDHILALSKGGSHSRANTQCACRRCNGIKADGAPRGQMGLFGAVHQMGAGGSVLLVDPNQDRAPNRFNASGLQESGFSR